MRPHIVYITGTLSFGGLERTVLELSAAPQLSEYKRSIICVLGRGGEYLQTALDKGTEVYYCPVRWPSSTPLPSYRVNRWIRKHLAVSCTFPRRLSALLRRIDADLVHTHFHQTIHLQARGVICRAHLPFIWTLQGLYNSRGHDTSNWPSVLDLISGTRNAALTAVSSAALQDVPFIDKLAAAQKMVIPNPVDLSCFNPTIPRDPRWRAQWGVPESVVCFGMAGRLVRIKRPDLFIEAAASVIRSGATAHFFIAGDGPLRESLERRIKDLELESYVHLIGYQSDMQRFLREMDVMVLCSDSEGLGLALIEASAMGLPCIATKVGGVTDVLGSDAGLLVQPGSVSALAQAMLSMLSADERQRYADRAIQNANRFSIDRVCAAYDELYRRLLAL